MALTGCARKVLLRHQLAEQAVEMMCLKSTDARRPNFGPVTTGTIIILTLCSTRSPGNHKNVMPSLVSKLTRSTASVSCPFAYNSKSVITHGHCTKHIPLLLTPSPGFFSSQRNERREKLERFVARTASTAAGDELDEIPSETIIPLPVLSDSPDAEPSVQWIWRKDLLDRMCTFMLPALAIPLGDPVRKTLIRRDHQISKPLKTCYKNHLYIPFFCAAAHEFGGHRLHWAGETILYTGSVGDYVQWTFGVQP